MANNDDTATILVADDDRNLLQALSIRLRAQGYEVITALDSYQALQFAQQRHPDLAILDINMPAGDGFTVQDRMQRIGDLTSIPVIYLTGDTSERAKQLAAEHNAVLLHKPFDDAELLAEIKVALRDASVC